ncbi:MAG: hypothetical protein HRT72_04795, partial [Flavobacteriales bacterium]|nr:hypothetical protein [Flavobacteriales bacterium]
MYWDNPSASDSSNASEVFSGSNNFKGVWHLNRAGPGYPDVSGNGNDAYVTDNQSEEDANDFILGSSQFFDQDNNEYLGVSDAAVLNPTDDFILSCWIKANSVGPSRAIGIKTTNDAWEDGYGLVLGEGPVPITFFTNNATGN